jgi:hypothetical protein
MVLDTTSEYNYNFDVYTGLVPTFNTVKIPAASTFGPPTQFFNSSTGSEIIYGHKAYDAAAYAPYVPPYYYGPQYIKLQFVPTSSGNYKYEDIINQLTVSCEPATSDLNYYFSSSINSLGGDASTGDFTGSTAYANRMPLSSSILYNVLVDDKQVAYKLSGEVQTATQTTDTSLSRWRIQTKFETPVLNFNTDLNKSISVLYETGSQFSTTTPKVGGGFTTINHSSSITKFGFAGMWGGYAQTGSNAGVKLSIEPGKVAPYSEITPTDDLASACGFDTSAQSKKYIGQIAQKKQISEAIVMIPFTKTRNHIGIDEKKVDINKAITIPEIIGENGKTSNNVTNGPYYFNVDKNVINDVFKDNNISIDFRDTKITYQDIKNLLVAAPNISNNSILNSMKLMTQYVVPPHLDWIFDRTIKPFAMYIFEFTHDLDGGELADIWQGVMPTSAMAATKDSVSIEHAFIEKEFFHGKKLPDDIQWKVFKVKKRANYLYDSLVNGKEERFEFKPGTSEELVYSYNWPYDYFSLVELVNIKASLEVDNTNTQTQETIINPSEIVKALQQPDSQKRIAELGKNTNKKLKGVK